MLPTTFGSCIYSAEYDSTLAAFLPFFHLPTPLSQQPRQQQSTMASEPDQATMAFEPDQAPMASEPHLEFGDGVFARISMGVPRPANPMLPFMPRRIATPIGNHPIVGLFDPDIRNRLHEIFDGADWSHITVCRVGYPGEGPEQCPATILVGVRPNTMNSDQAGELLRSAADCVYRFIELRDVVIEIIEANVVAYAAESTASHPRGYHGERCVGYKVEEAFRDEPLIGVGIALSDSTTSGTLGGYLKIGTATKSKHVALTSHHVLSSRFLNCLPPLLLTLTLAASDDEKAVFPTDKPRSAVTCPPQREIDD
jgi:hypothetical protein